MTGGTNRRLQPGLQALSGILCAGFLVASANEARPQQPAFSVTVSAIDKESGKPLDEFQVVPTPFRNARAPVTWQSQYRRTLTPGDALFTMKRGWEQTLLRAEAPGYLPVVSDPLPRKRGQTWKVEMQRDPGFKGTIRQPNGRPAEGATLAMCTWTNEVTVEGGKLRYGSHASRSRELVVTGEDGAFHLPTEQDECVLVVAHESGYAERTRDELKESTDVKLEPWGRVEGQLVVGGKPVAGQRIDLGSGRGDVQVVLHYSGEATTDDQGHFVVDKLPPVKLYVSPEFTVGETRVKPLWFSGLTKIKAGEVTQITVPRRGQSVTGRVKLPEGSTLRFEDLDVEVGFSLRPPSVSGNQEYVRKAWAAHAAFMQSEFGAAFRRDPVRVAADGTFRVDDLPETSWVMAVTAKRKADRGGADPAAIVAAYSTRVRIAPRTPDEETHDVGDVTLRPR